MAGRPLASSGASGKTAQPRTRLARRRAEELFGLPSLPSAMSAVAGAETGRSTKRPLPAPVAIHVVASPGVVAGALAPEAAPRKRRSGR